MAAGDSSRDTSGRQRLRLGLAIFCAVLALGPAPCRSAAAAPSVAPEEMQRIREYVQSKRLPAVTTAETKHDGPIDCVRLEDQPSMQHPSMKGHKIKLAPSIVPEGLAGLETPPGLHSRVSCPAGTVPIRRLTESQVSMHGSLDAYLAHQSRRRGAVPPEPGSPGTRAGRKSMETDFAATSDAATTAAIAPRFEYAVANFVGKTYGVNTSPQLWDPYVEAVSQVSTSRMVFYVAAGSGSTYNQIMAGLEVDPLTYGGNTDPHIFITWTRDGFRTTGCVDFGCQAFVQVNPNVYLGASAVPWMNVSNIATNYYYVGTISFDATQNTWWYYWYSSAVGYYPGSLFSLLNNQPATSASVGGVVWNDYPQGRHTKTQMGSGRFPTDPATAIHASVQVATNSTLTMHTFVPKSLTITDSGCYSIVSIYNAKTAPLGTALKYGGPGYDPVKCPGPKKTPPRPPPPPRHPPPPRKSPPPPPPPFNASAHAKGLVPPGTAGIFKRLNPYFRYASYGYNGDATFLDWGIDTHIDWSTRGVVLPAIKDQGTCGACWAFAAVAAIEGANALFRGVLTSGSEQQIIDCQGVDSCVGGWPGDALDYVAYSTFNRTGGLASEAKYPYIGNSARGCRAAAGVIGVQMWEQVDFYGWFGLLLAVQNQPVIVNIEADQLSFINYRGGIYDDPTCFKNTLVDHTVALVGYNLGTNTPYWIIRNSWGPLWGEGGYMRLAISGGNGICGIASTPGFYPVLQSSNPCGSGKVNNPCGGGTCVKGNALYLNTCVCPQGFVAVTNIDRSQSCAPAKVCNFYLFNPCNLGTCINDGLGGYGCICRAGFVQGSRADGSRTCVPAALGTTYTVQKGDTCYLIYTAFELTETQFMTLNPHLSCGNLKPGAKVNVRHSKTCSLTYSINPGDTCVAVEILFGLPNSTFLALNPGLRCTALYTGQQVCVASGTLVLPTCQQYYAIEAGDTCDRIWARFKLTPTQLYAYNPGINCNNLQPTNGGAFPGEAVCISVAATGHIGCPHRSYRVKRGDTCTSIIYHEFARSYARFQRLNRNLECRSGTLYVGQLICIS